ncbi:hypothetical protein NQ317_009351 [Molorchus minor]|uniref:Uncharacterized protein n=1 Tax=Molorchus minor TaxID=1323400 RepID=A0ABQ9JL78_9CUCU|nr:hypothetical protein NQ317_009351 [Molorchus minor]
MEVAEPSYQLCISKVDEIIIKNKVREYLILQTHSRLLLKLNRRNSMKNNISDIHALLCMYRDNTFTGRAVARFCKEFQSPNYPATIWGRFLIIIKLLNREGTLIEDPGARRGYMHIYEKYIVNKLFNHPLLNDVQILFHLACLSIMIPKYFIDSASGFTLLHILLTHSHNILDEFLFYQGGSSSIDGD